MTTSWSDMVAIYIQLMFEMWLELALDRRNAHNDYTKEANGE